MSGRSGRKRWIPAGLLVLVAVAFWAFGLNRYLELAWVIQRQNQLQTYVSEHWAAMLSGYMILYTLIVALSIPGASILTITGGFLFGWIWGGLAALLGATFGALAVFLVARSSLGAVFARRAGPFLTRLAGGFRESAASYLLFLRLTPVFPFWLVNIAPALLGIRFNVYLWTTILGILPGTFAFSVIGSGLGSVIEAQELASPGCTVSGACTVELEALITPQLLAAFFALGIAALIPILVRFLRRKSRQKA
ncbi:TVP38/TMEM64 family protein [Roseibium litorale]|uniref:TVP38/TMEM64 family protein n=1 Tax=Roseibium litorale TaxID=2803841 RepID=UPI001AD8E69F|nr:VTT domain-containing protein [Roseibium litorale]